MSNRFRPLWQLLLRTADPRQPPNLTCADCFMILEYLADIATDHDDRPALIQKARHHLTACPDCQTYYQQRLDELEALLNEENEKGAN